MAERSAPRYRRTQRGPHFPSNRPSFCLMVENLVAFAGARKALKRSENRMRSLLRLKSEGKRDFFLLRSCDPQKFTLSAFGECGKAGNGLLGSPKNPDLSWQRRRRPIELCNRPGRSLNELATVTRHRLSASLEFYRRNKC